MLIFACHEWLVCNSGTMNQNLCYRTVAKLVLDYMSSFIFFLVYAKTEYNEKHACKNRSKSIQIEVHRESFK